MGNHMSGKKQIVPSMEYNVAVLGLIASQSKQPAEKYRSGWEYESPDSSFSISCRTGHPSGIPYGLCNDILSGVMTAFAAQQTSEDENPWLELTLTDIAKFAGITPEKQHYQIIETALRSMQEISYTLKNCYQLPVLGISRKETVGFHIISNYHLREDEHQFNSKQKVKTYRILLDPILAASIRGPHTLSLAPSILGNLKSPTSRALYRFLDGARRDLDDPQKTRREIQMPLEAFLSSMRVLSDARHISDRAKTLIRKGGPLETLRDTDTAFLEDYDILGRGDSSVIVFRFHDQNGTDMRGVRLLEEYGVAHDSAKAVMEAHTLEEVECAIWKMETSKSKKDNPAGYILKLLKNESAKHDLEKFRQRDRKRHVGAPKTIDMHVPGETAPTVRYLPAASEPEQPEITLETEIRTLQTLRKLSLKHAELCEEMAAQHLLSLDDLKPLKMKLAAEAQAEVEKWATERLQ